MKKIFTVNNEMRLTEFLSAMTVGVSKSKIVSQIKRGEAKVNGKKVSADLNLCVGDIVAFFIPASMELKLSVIFSDDNIAIVDKPAHTDVEEALTYRMREAFGYAEPCHRLDRNTKGLVAFALNPVAYKELTLAFKERRVKKEYLAQTVGSIQDGIYEAYLFKDSALSRVYIASEQKSGYKPIKTGIEFISKDEVNLARIKLYTGRTHQIRAHLAYLGCPVLGDDKYGNHEANKKANLTVQKLKSVKLEFLGLQPPLDYLNGKVFTSGDDYID